MKNTVQLQGLKVEFALKIESLREDQGYKYSLPAGKHNSGFNSNNGINL